MTQRLMNTNNKQDLKRFAQAQMLIKYALIVSLDEIVLLEFSGNKVITDYLLFKVGNVTYNYRNYDLTIAKNI